MARSLVLHIGSHKTGTTSIQQRLAECRDLLRDHGVYYCAAFGVDASHSLPVVRMFSPSPGDYIHVARSGLDPSEVALLAEADRAALIEEIEAIVDGVYVISGEDIASLTEEGVARLRDFCDAHFDDVTVVYAVREPISLIRSIHHQLLTSGERRAESFRPRGVAPRYDVVPLRFAKAFGVDRMRVHRFEDAVAEGVVVHFARRHLGVVDDRLSDVHLNRGLSTNGARLLRLWGRAFPHERPGFVARRIAAPARGILARAPGPRDRSHPPIDAAAAARINQAVATLAAEFDVEPYEPVAP